MQATQKKIRILSVQPGLRGAVTYASDEKWRPFNSFSVHGTDGSPTGPDPENRVGDQDIGSPGKPVSSWMQAPSQPRHCHARRRHPC